MLESLTPLQEILAKRFSATIESIGGDRRFIIHTRSPIDKEPIIEVIAAEYLKLDFKRIGSGLTFVKGETVVTVSVAFLNKLEPPYYAYNVSVILVS